MHISDLPSDIADFCRGGNWQEITVGASGDLVFRITHPEKPTYYLKVATNPSEEVILAEKARLEWLQGRLPVPSIIAFATDSQHTYLLLSEVQGLMSFDEHFSQDIPTVVRLLAEGLRMIHGLDITRCPFDMGLSYKIPLAQERVRAGLVDEEDLDEQRRGMHADELMRQLFESQPKTEDLVFTHGDYCLPNILIDPSTMQLSGFIDLGRAGIADRYQDLALVARSLPRNFGPDWEPLLWEAYGLKKVDAEKIQFYQLLDEFF